MFLYLFCVTFILIRGWVYDAICIYLHIAVNIVKYYPITYKRKTLMFPSSLALRNPWHLRGIPGQWAEQTTRALIG